MALLAPELRPGPPFGDAGIDGFFDHGGADAAGGFHFLAVVVEAVGDYGLGTVFVCGDLRGGEGGGIIVF